MNLGGEPERDDSGLPPVDIEIPDDARELDRDVQAYQRELRALRRHQRRMRLNGPLTRDGVVLPLLASCLVLALIAGTLLTVFAAGPGGDLPGTIGTSARSAASSGPPASRSPASQANSPAELPTRGKLPDKVIEVNGARRRLPTLIRSVLALVPASCGCTAAVQRLTRQASAAGVRIYLVGDSGQLATVRRLAAKAPGQAVPADDLSGVLDQAYPHTGLAALLVHLDGTVGVAAPLASDFMLTGQLRSLRAPATTPAKPSLPARSSTAPSAPVR